MVTKNTKWLGADFAYLTAPYGALGRVAYPSQAIFVFLVAIL